MKFTLYCFAESGNAYKAALMLNLCGANWTPRHVDFFGGETRTDAYLAVNDMGEVPVLETGELRLSQSAVILDYLADRFEMFDAQNVPEHREIMRWLFFDNHRLTNPIATLRFLRRFAKTGETEVTRFLEKRAEKALAVLERRLDASSFVIGERPTIADLSLCGYLYWPDEIGLDWTPFPNVAAWLERIRELPSWVAPYDLMPGDSSRTPEAAVESESADS